MQGFNTAAYCFHRNIKIRNELCALSMITCLFKVMYGLCVLVRHMEVLTKLSGKFIRNILVRTASRKINRRIDILSKFPMPSFPKLIWSFIEEDGHNRIVMHTFKMNASIPDSNLFYWSIII